MIEELRTNRPIDLTSLKVLLFHGEQASLKDSLFVLRWCGLRDITLAGRLSEAFKHLESVAFDLIVVTHVGEAPETTRFLEKLKGLDAGSDLPVVAITAGSSVKNILRMLAQGVDHVMVTPLSRDTVENVVQNLLREQIQNDLIKDSLKRANELLADGEFDSARKIYREILLQDTGSLDVYLGLFRVSCGLKQWQKAENYIKSALDLAKSCTDKMKAHRQLARVFHHYGSYYAERQQAEKAIESYRTSLSLNPFHTESVTALLLQLQKRDAADEIINVIQKVTGNYLPYSHALNEIALCIETVAQRFLDLNMGSQARSLYEQLLMLSHENVPVHLKVTDFFLNQGVVSPVLKRLLELIERLKDSDLFFKTGSVLLDAEKRFLSGNPTRGTGNMDLSFFEGLDSEKVLAMTQKILQQGLSIQPEHFDLAFALAELHMEVGRYSDAIVYYEKAIKLAPSEQSPQKGLKRALHMKRQKDKK
jgi:tetratricopeptide (TPR) repeat protein